MPYFFKYFLFSLLDSSYTYIRLPEVVLQLANEMFIEKIFGLFCVLFCRASLAIYSSLLIFFCNDLMADVPIVDFLSKTL